jgi:hypothetical protein
VERFDRNAELLSLTQDRVSRKGGQGTERIDRFDVKTDYYRLEKMPNLCSAQVSEVHVNANRRRQDASVSQMGEVRAPKCHPLYICALS